MSDSDPRPDEEEPPEWAKERAREIAAAEDADAGDADATDESSGDADRAPDIPRDAVAEAERLTRLARDATDDAAAAAYRERRDALVAAHDYEPRIREEDDTLVLYPTEWVADGTVQFDRIENTDRGVEVSLSGPGDAERYEAVASHNAAVADRIEREHGAAHAKNVRAFGEFMANHYVKELDRATPGERAEFLEEYYPRNVWPDEDQRAVVEESLTLVDDALSE